MSVAASAGPRLRFDIVVLAVWALGAGACANHTSAPVVERSVSAHQPEEPVREVVAGDTLYSIAWESGRDYRELATWNGIPPPYTIKPGQRIRLQPPSGASPSTPAAATHTVQRGETLYSIATRYDLTVADVAAWNGIRSPYTIRPGQQLRLVGTGSATANSKRKGPSNTTNKSASTAVPARSRAAKTAISKDPVGAWTWPTTGRLLSRFSSNGSKGIDISGNPGQSIVAAAPGTVVYQGSGLRGYGQLIIVKHNRDFLSAYAHCNKIVVREGNVIQRGQKIAEMGSTGTDRVKLHFEIRFRGNPVDPLDHLPKK